MPTTYEIIIGVLAFAYLCQAWYIGKLIRLRQEMAKEHTNLLLAQAEHQLAEAMLEQNKVQVMTQKDLVEAIQILNDRVAAYNERLNNLAMSLIDKNSVHM